MRRTGTGRTGLPGRAVAAVVVGSLLTACAATGPGTPVDSSTTTAAALDAMARALEEPLAGARLTSAEEAAGRLSAARPEARRAADWPGADYAVLAPRDAAEPTAAGLLTWIGDDASGWTTACVTASVDRAAVRLRLEEVHCPPDVPTAPVEPEGSEQWARVLDLDLPVTAPLATGNPAPAGLPQPGWTVRAPAAATAGCAVSQLSATIESGSAAGPTDDLVLRVQNASPSACVLTPGRGLTIDDGKEVLRPSWQQAAGDVTLGPWESAAARLSYRPHEGGWGPQSLTLETEAGPVRVSPPAGRGTAVRVGAASTLSVTAWAGTWYGVAPGRWEDGFPVVDVAPPCRSEQLAVTAVPPRRGSSPDDPPQPRPYLVANISTSACRLDAGPVPVPTGIPELRAPTPVALAPGAAHELGDGAPDLTGTLAVGGEKVPVATP